jgi:hypothetical protein
MKPPQEGRLDTVAPLRTATPATACSEPALNFEQLGGELDTTNTTGRLQVARSNSLTVLADRIRDAIGASFAAEKTAIEKAIEAGHLLHEAKDVCQHGEWLPFLHRAGMPERKAQRYMKLARSGLKPDTVSDLGLAIFSPAYNYVDELKRPIVLAEYVLPAAFALLDNRHREMSFKIVEDDFEFPSFEKWLRAVLGDDKAEFESKVAAAETERAGA